MSTPKILLTIDGNNLGRRMLYGAKPLSHKGQYTHAVYGSLMKIEELIKKLKPTHLNVAFDMRGKNFRNDLYPEYKGNRSADRAKAEKTKPKPPHQGEETFHWQLERLQELLPHLGYHTLMKKGHEADDFIGSSAVQFVEHYHEPTTHVYMWGGDKDFSAVVKKQITHIYPITYVPGQDNHEWLDRKGVFQKFGVKPRQMTDYLAMMGDKIDNVPGIRGIGPTNARQLLAKFDNLKNILRRLDELTPTQRRCFEECGREQILLYRQVIKIELGLELSFKRMKLRPENGDPERAQHLKRKLGIKT